MKNIFFTYEYWQKHKNSLQMDSGQWAWDSLKAELVFNSDRDMSNKALAGKLSWLDLRLPVRSPSGNIQEATYECINK